MTLAPSLIGKTIHFEGRVLAVCRANNNEEKCVSLQDTSNALFLRHKDGKIVETSKDVNPEFFPDDSSFVPEERSDGFILRCSNKGMEEHYVCKIDTDTFIVNRYLEEYIFRSTSDGFVGSSCGVCIGRCLNANGVQYLLVPANDGNPFHVSLLNATNGLYARHFSGKLIESGPEKNAKAFPYDSSFRLEPQSDGMIVCCVNQGMENTAVARGANKELIIEELSKAYVFPITGALGAMELLKAAVSNTGRLCAMLNRKKKFWIF